MRQLTLKLPVALEDAAAPVATNDDLGEWPIRSEIVAEATESLKIIIHQYFRYVLFINDDS